MTQTPSAHVSQSQSQLHPSVLHLAAHSTFSRLVFSLHGVAWPVGYDAFAAMIGLSFRPMLVVLTMCDSHAPSHGLRGLVKALITWPGQTDDGRRRTFAGQLYEALAVGDTVISVSVCRYRSAERRDSDCPAQ